MPRRFMLFALLATFAFSLTIVQTPAAYAAGNTAVTARVNTYRLNVRTMPNVRATRVGVLKESAVVMIIGHDAKS